GGGGRGPGVLPRRHRRVDRHRRPGAKRRGGGGVRPLRLGRHRHLGSAGAGEAARSQGQRHGRAGRAARCGRLHRVERRGADRAGGRARPGRGGGQRAGPRHGPRPRGGPQEVHRCPAGGDPGNPPVTRLICLEPGDPGAAWAPFTGSRPLAELRAGAWRIHERWAGVLDVTDVTVMGAHTPGFVDADVAPLRPPGPIAGPAVVARSDFAPAGQRVDLDEDVGRLTHGGQIVAWIVPEGETWAAPKAWGDALPVEGLLLRGAWDLVTALERLLPADCAGCRSVLAEPVPAGWAVLGE